MKKLILISVAFAFVATLTITVQSCKKDTTTTAAAHPTLYDTLGAVALGTMTPAGVGTAAVGAGSTMVADPVHTGSMIQAGQLVIRDVVDSALFIIAGDNAINSYFTVLIEDITDSGGVSSTGFTNLQTNLTNFFSVGTGAPTTGSLAITYSGKSMQNAHNPSTNYRISHVVTAAAFTQFTNDVVAAAAQNGVPSSSPIVASLGAIIGSLQSSVVNQ